MKRFFLCLIAFSCFWSCNNEQKANTNVQILGKDKMVKVLVDIHLAESALNAQQLYAELSTQKALDYYEYIFNKYNTNRKTFTASFEYYVARPVEFDEIYEKVLAELSKIDSGVN